MKLRGDETMTNYGLTGNKIKEIMNSHTFIEYKRVIHNEMSGVSHPKGTPLISVLNKEGADGWIVCGMIKDNRPRERTDIYFYREVIVKEL